MNNRKRGDVNHGDMGFAEGWGADIARGWLKQQGLIAAWECSLPQESFDLILGTGGLSAATPELVCSMLQPGTDGDAQTTEITPVRYEALACKVNR
jgi:hypothetical protein